MLAWLQVLSHKPIATSEITFSHDIIHRQHQCPLHTNWTGNLLHDDRQKREYHPKTHYQVTFQSASNQGSGHKGRGRPGLKVPLRLLPDIPKKGAEAVSTNHADFVKLPVVPTKNFKPEENVHQCGTKFEDTTSYKLDFPQQKSIPKLDEIPLKENLCTEKWAGFTEHPSQLYFTQKFNGKPTVNRDDFHPDIIEKRRRKATIRSSLPALVEKQPVYLKKQSRKHCETMHPLTGHIQKWTQYQIDNPGYIFFPQARGICTPAPDSLQLFHGPFDGRTENHLNYVQFQEPPRPRTSFKKRDEVHTKGAMFHGTTSTGTHYPPIPTEQQVAELRSVDRLAVQVGRYQKDGYQMKKAHNFGGKFFDESVNKSDFQFWQTGPRTRYGDRAERVFQPSKAKLASVSESHATFVPLKGKPSESFKPLDTRFKEQLKSKKKKTTMDYATVYKRDFKEKQLPIREICPAEFILQQA